MVKRFHYFSIAVSLIMGASAGFGEWNPQNAMELYRSTLKTERLNLTKSVPDSATYIGMHTFFYAPEAADSGYVVFYVIANIPGGDPFGNPDPAYTGIVDLHIFEEYDDTTASFYDALFNPTDSVELVNGQAVLLLMDTEPEELIVYASARDGGLKPSTPSVAAFDSSGTTPIRLLIDGPEKINASIEEGPSGGRYLIKVVDDSDHIVSSYGDFLDTTKVMLSVGGSAELWDLLAIFAGSENIGQSIKVTLLSGMGQVMLSDTISEVVTLIATSLVGLGSDTLVVDVRPPDEPTTLMLWSFSGVYGTVGVPKNFLAIAFAEEGPDPNNNTTEVRVSINDIIGSLSATVSPSDSQTLSSGIAQFTISDTEADTGLIVKTEIGGTPQLYPFWMMGDKQAYGFKDPGEAVVMRPSFPFTGVVGDTVTVTIYTTDAADSVDLNYTGYLQLEAEEDNGSCQVLEYLTGIPQNIISVQDSGVGRIWLVNSEAEEVGLYMWDAEGGGESPFARGYLGYPSPEGVTITFENPGGVATSWEVQVNPTKRATAGYTETVTIKAVDGAGLVDTAYNDIAHIDTTVARYAVLSDTLVPIIRGIGTVDVVDDSAECVVIIASDSLDSGQDTLWFYEPGKAALLMGIGPYEVLVNGEAPFAVYAMSPGFQIDTTWTGVAKLVSGSPNVSAVSGNLDSIVIDKGTGSITITDTVVEEVWLHFEYVSGPSPLASSETSDVEFEVRLDCTLPSEGSVGGTPDTITFRTVDANDSLYPYNTTIDSLWANVGTVTFNPSPPNIQITDGICYVEIEDTEAETVDVYAQVYDALVEDREDYVGQIVFSTVGIKFSRELRLFPKVFSLSQNYPNPFRSSTVIRYSLSKPSHTILRVYDASGRVVKTLVDRKQVAGYYRVRWDLKDEKERRVASGVYFYVLKAHTGSETGNFEKTRKLILFR